VLSPVRLHVLRWAIADSAQIGISTFRGERVKLNNSLCPVKSFQNLHVMYKFATLGMNEIKK